MTRRRWPPQLVQTQHDFLRDVVHSVGESLGASRDEK